MPAGFFLTAIKREPLRTLPAEGLPVYAALRLQALVDGAGLGRAAIGLFLARRAGGEGHAVIEEDLGTGVVDVREGAVAARVELRHVDVGVAVEYPLREVFAAATALRDAEGGAAAHPEIRHTRRGPEERTTIGRVRNGAVHDATDAHLAKDRHALDGALEPEADAVQIVGEELAGGFPLGETVRRPGLDKARVLVDADQTALLLLTVIARHPRIPHHGQFACALDKSGDRVGDHIVVLHVADGGIGPDHLRHLPRIAARRVHHHAGNDAALLGDHFPFARGSTADAGHAVLADDRGAQIARALGHGVAEAGRIRVAVIGGVCRCDHTLGGEEGVQLTGPRGGDDLHVEANGLGETVDALHPRELALVVGKAHAARGMPAHVLAGLGLQRGVQLVAVGVDLGEVVAARDAGALAGSVPGGARGELVFLDQDGVGAALEGQVVEEARPHDSATDDHDIRTCFHGRAATEEGRTISRHSREGQLKSSSRLVEFPDTRTRANRARDDC